MASYSRLTVCFSFPQAAATRDSAELRRAGFGSKASKTPNSSRSDRPRLPSQAQAEDNFEDSSHHDGGELLPSGVFHVQLIAQPPRTLSSKRLFPSLFDTGLDKAGPISAALGSDDFDHSDGSHLLPSREDYDNQDSEDSGELQSSREPYFPSPALQVCALRSLTLAVYPHWLPRTRNRWTARNSISNSLLVMLACTVG